MEDKKEEKRLYPGDVGYKGGGFDTTVIIDGKVKNVHTIKDANGNVVYMSVRDKFLGLF